MRNLLQLLIRYSNLLWFILLEVIAFVCLIGHNRYQWSAVWSTANAAIGWCYTMNDDVIDYFHLRKVNDQLAEENIELLERINLLEGQIQYLAEADSSVLNSRYLFAERDVDYIPAKVINFTSQKTRNFITLNKGTSDGVELDMGVIDHNGVVGIVTQVSDHFSVVMPLINPAYSLSCRFTNNDHYGPLKWDGMDYRYGNLEDIARHIEVSVGDTLVTSGLTPAFPEGIHVGVVEKADLADSDAYYHIRVRYATDFRSLRYVQIVLNKKYLERREIEHR